MQTLQSFYFLYTDVLPAVCDANYPSKKFIPLGKCSSTTITTTVRSCSSNTRQKRANGWRRYTDTEYGLKYLQQQLRVIYQTVRRPAIADVKFIIEGKSCILYRFLLKLGRVFQAMFRGGMSESIENQQQLLA